MNGLFVSREGLLSTVDIGLTAAEEMTIPQRQPDDAKPEDPPLPSKRFKLCGTIQVVQQVAIYQEV